MKLFGTLSELVAIVFRKDTRAITIRPNQSTTYLASTDVQLAPTADTTQTLVEIDATQTLTNKTMSFPTLITPTSTDGSFTSVDTFSLDDTDSAFNLGLQSTSTLTANRNLTFDVDDGSRTLELSGDLRTVGGNSTTLTTTGGTNVTLPTTGTLATLAGAEALTNKTIGTTNTVTLLDTAFTLRDNADNTKQALFELGSITTGQTRQYTLPDANTALVGEGTTQTLQNKTIDNTNTITVKDTLLTIQDNADTTKQLKFEASGITTGTTRTLTAPDASTTIVGTDAIQTLTDKKLVDNTTTIIDNSDATKKIAFDAGGTTGTTSTITGAQTANRVITLPDATTTLVGTDNTQTLTNKTLTGNIAVNLVSGAATVTLPTSTSTLATLALTETLTNKTLQQDLVDDFLAFNEESAPATAAANTVRVYAKADGRMYSKDDAGTESALTAATVATATATGTVTSYVPVIQSAISTVTNANATATTSDGFHTYLFSTGGTDRTLTLPAASANTGRTITIKKTDSGAGMVTVDANGAELIDVDTTRVVWGSQAYLTIICDGTGWRVAAEGWGIYTKWQSVTVTGSWTTNTTYTSVMRRDGDMMHWRVKLAIAGGVTATALTITLPLSLTIQNVAIWAATTNKTLGRVSGFDATGDTYSGMVNYNNSTSVGIFGDYAGLTWLVQGNPVNSTDPVTWASGDAIYIEAIIPITQWL